MRNPNRNNLSLIKKPPSGFYHSHKQYLLDRLLDLDGIQQNPRFHPEIDVLYHSLQVFELAVKETSNPLIRAAALFHDIGKAIDMKHHAVIGAEMVDNILSEPIPWLIEHHLDLFLYPRRVRKKLKNTPQLKQLERLRYWDLQGRKTQLEVISPMRAIEIISQTDEIFQSEK